MTIACWQPHDARHRQHTLTGSGGAKELRLHHIADGSDAVAAKAALWQSACCTAVSSLAAFTALITHCM